MVGKEIDPADIGKHSRYIKMAQDDISEIDVLVCGRCHMVYHFIEEFQDHQLEGCDKEPNIRKCRESRPAVWAFLLWKATQTSSLKESGAPQNSWKLYQTWIKMDSNIRETWIVAGKTIQSFNKLGQGNLQEMPVKITKTVIDSGKNSPVHKTANNVGGKSGSPITTSGRFADGKMMANKKIGDIDSDSSKNEVHKIRRPMNSAINTNSNAKLTTSTPLQKFVNRMANRTDPNTQETKEEPVEKILAKRFNPRKKSYEYLVKWEHHSQEQNTWEIHSHLERVSQILELFEKQLARQKEQRAALQQAKEAGAAQAAKAAIDIKKEECSMPLQSPKIECGSESDSMSGVKRKLDDSDFDDTPSAIPEEDLDEELIPSHTLKRQKSGNTVSVKVETKHEVKTHIKSVNGSGRGDGTCADVIITKDNSSSGVLKKASNSTIPSPGEASTTKSGIVRLDSVSTSVGSGGSATIVSSSTPSGIQRKQTPGAIMSTTATSSTDVTSSGQPVYRSVQQSNKPATKPSVTTNIGNVQITQINRNPTAPNKLPTTKVIPPSGTKQMSPRILQTQPKQTTIVQRTSLSPSTASNIVSPNSGKMIIQQRTVAKSAPTSKNVTPEQKIIQLSKSGDLRVTKKTIPPAQQSPIQSQMKRLRPEPSQIQIQKIQQIAPPNHPENESEPELTLCPTTGKILGGPQEEELEQQLLQQQQQEQQQEGQPFDLNNLDQQMMTNEDGTPLLVSGEDGTIYQVAGKNAEGQTILIAQGRDGEQQFAYVASDENEMEGAQVAGNNVLTLDNAVAEAVSQMAPEQQQEAYAAAAAEQQQQQFSGEVFQAEGSNDSNLQQPLMIETGNSDSQEANIPAEVVRAEPPSPGGTRKVVLLLQDGTFVVTEMHDDEYQALNIVT